MTLIYENKWARIHNLRLWIFNKSTLSILSTKKHLYFLNSVCISLHVIEVAMVHLEKKKWHFYIFPTKIQYDRGIYILLSLRQKIIEILFNNDTYH